MISMRAVVGAGPYIWEYMAFTIFGIILPAGCIGYSREGEKNPKIGLDFPPMPW